MKKSLDTDKFLKELAKYKKDNKLTYEGLAIKTGVHRITLHRWISGAVRPRYATMCRVTGILGFRTRGLAPKVRVSVGQFTEPVDFSTLEAVAHNMYKAESAVLPEFVDHVLLKLFYAVHTYVENSEFGMRCVSLVFDKVPDAGGGILLTGKSEAFELCVTLKIADTRLFWNIRKVETNSIKVIAEGVLTERGFTNLLRIIGTNFKGEKKW